MNLFSGYCFDESSDREFRKKNLSIIDKFITHDVYIATINNNREKKPLLLSTMQEPQFNKMTNLVFCNSATTEGAGLYYDVLGTFDRRELYLKWKILNLNYYEFLCFRSKYFYISL